MRESKRRPYRHPRPSSRPSISSDISAIILPRGAILILAVHREKQEDLSELYENETISLIQEQRAADERYE